MEANSKSYKADINICKAEPQKKKWTFMVYIAGDNNLDPAALQDIAEMAKAGSSEKLNVIVQLDRANDQKTRRFYITRGGGYKRDCIETFGETNTGDPAVLENFIRWGIEKYPASRYALVIWNHGGGWWDEPRKARRNIGYDDSSEGDALNNQELQDVLDRISRLSGSRIDILGMDACLMAMLEVAYQLRSSVDVLVGSEEEEPFDGWPYDGVLSLFRNRPARKSATLGRGIVEEYIRFYKGKKEAVTQAAFNVRNITGSLLPALDDLSGELIAGIADLASKETGTESSDSAGERELLMEAIADARAASPSFFYDNYLDLHRFVYVLGKECIREGIRNKAGEVLKALKPGSTRTLIYQKHLGTELRHARGMSIYFPTDEINPRYRELDFYRDCRWGEFLERYIEVARAQPDFHKAKSNLHKDNVKSYMKAKLNIHNT